MATNQKLGGKGVPSDGLLSGYEGQNVPEDFSIPSVGIEDVDRALFELFDKHLPIHVNPKNNPGASEKIPVVFASGERFATRMRKNPLRDENGQFILPIISIVGTGINQSVTAGPDNNGMALGTSTGDLVIKKKLSPKDRQYQSLINKLNLKNQKNVSSKNNFESSTNETGNLPGKIASRRKKFAGLGDELLTNDSLGNNVFEIITIPFPQFFVSHYQITFWAQYRQHLNQMIERLMTNYNDHYSSIRLDTDKGYWFVAYFDDDFTSEDNSDDFPDEERILKYTLNVSVPAFIVAPKNPGDPSPFRRYISAPQVSFGIYESNDDLITTEKNSNNPSGDIDDFILSDVTQLDKQGNKKTGRVSNTFKSVIVKDRITGQETTKFVKVISKNTRVGETVIGGTYLDDLDLVNKKWVLPF